MSEGSQFFEGRGAVQEALRKITRRLNDLKIPYTVIDGMALFRHGYRRFTEDVDLLVTREGLKLIHEALDGLGYLPPFPHARNLRDTELGVKIEFLITGDYPGDGKPKPVAFPDPLAASFEAEGIRYRGLDALIELKLASGITAPSRARDLSDVLELIRACVLPLEYAGRLNEYVRPEFIRLWHSARRRFVKLWRMDPATTNALDAMKQDGILIVPAERRGPDYVRLVTTDPKIAEKHGLVDEAEWWDDYPTDDANAE